MGLDQWLYRVERLSAGDKASIDAMSYTELLDSSEFTVMDAEGEDEGVKAIVDMSYVVTKDTEEWDSLESL